MNDNLKALLNHHTVGGFLKSMLTVSYHGCAVTREVESLDIEQVETLMKLVVRECASLAHGGPSGILTHFELK